MLFCLFLLNFIYPSSIYSTKLLKHNCRLPHLKISICEIINRNRCKTAAPQLITRNNWATTASNQLFLLSIYNIDCKRISINAYVCAGKSNFSDLLQLQIFLPSLKERYTVKIIIKQYYIFSMLSITTTLKWIYLKWINWHIYSIEIVSMCSIFSWISRGN